MLKLKKILSCICVLTLTASLFLTTASATEPNADIQSQADWDGTVAAEFAGGDGSAQSPFLIETAAQLAKCVTYGGEASRGKYFMLANDIVVNSDLSNATKNWYETVYNNPADNRIFNGVFDGNGHVVSGIYYKNGSGNPASGTSGLFPAATKDTRIKNVGIVNSYFRSGYYAGAILGSIISNNVAWVVNGYSDTYPSIVNCFVGSDVEVNADCAGGFIGVATGNNNGRVSIHNCCFLGKLTCKTRKGFEAGDYWNMNIHISSTFSTETLNANKRKSFATTSKVYTTATALEAMNGTKPAQVTEEQAKGEAAKTSMKNLDFDNVWKTNENDYPSLRVFDPDSPSVWDGKSVDQSFYGDGTAESPYLINNAAELAGLVTLGKTATTGNYYRLTTDVNLAKKPWYLSNSDYETNVFNGTFDGAGHTVSGIYYSTGEGKRGTGGGLFPGISNNAHIKNVGIRNMNADMWGAETSCGAIFGFAYLTNSYDHGDGVNSTKYPTIEYCYADSSVTLIKAPFNGGIGGTVIGDDGKGFLRISNCYFTGRQFYNGQDHGYGICGSIGDIYGAEAYIFNFYSTFKFKAKNGNIRYTNSYTTADPSAWLKPGTQLPLESMQGENALENMTGFDFDSVWQTVDGETPTLRAFNKTTLDQQIITSSVSYDSNGNADGTKFVARVSLPGDDINDITDGVITAKVDGKLNIVEETGMIIARDGADEYALSDIKNDPLTGIRVVGYKKGNVNEDKLAFGDSRIVLSVNVKGTQKYTARSYTVFTDGTVVMGEKYMAEPTGYASADGFTVNDDYQAGDANFDGQLNILDLIKIKKYAAESGGFKAEAIMDIIDLNSDNAFNAADIAELRKALLNGCADTQTAEWSLVWADEFDCKTINSENWSFADLAGGYSDMPTITDSSVQSIKKNDDGDSYLRLTTYKYGEEYRAVKSVTSANSMTFKYGYVEMRAKLPAGKGAWPSFWMQSVPQNGNYMAEVDIFEVMGQGNGRANIHKWYESGTHNNHGGDRIFTVADNDWHTYGMLWDENQIVMYVDGRSVVTYDLNKNFGSYNKGMEGFRDPMYLIINNQIITTGFSSSDNGSWAEGLEVDSDFTKSVYDIDYVRLYQKNDGSSVLNLLK